MLLLGLLPGLLLPSPKKKACSFWISPRIYRAIDKRCMSLDAYISSGLVSTKVIVPDLSDITNEYVEDAFREIFPTKTKIAGKSCRCRILLSAECILKLRQDFFFLS